MVQAAQKVHKVQDVLGCCTRFRNYRRWWQKWFKRFIRYRRVLKDLGGAKIHMVPEGSEGVRWCRWRMYVVT